MSIRMAHALGVATVVAATLAVCTPLAARAQAREEGTRLSYGVKTSADTVRIGDPFTVAIRVRAPAGAQIEFPAGPDSTSAVQLIDPRTVRTVSDSGAIDLTATYRLAAWDVGRQPIELGDVIVTGAGPDRRISIEPQSVFVQSVLPADSTLRVPKPARPIFDQSIPRWWLWALIAVAAALLLFALWWWWRRRRRNAPKPVENPLAVAEKEFSRIEALRLVEAGEPGRHVALMTDVLRDYLAARFPNAPLSLTTGELTRALHREPTVALEKLSHLLDEVDLIKFARRPVSRDRAIEIGREARLLVRAIDAAYVARETAARETADKREAA